MLNPQHPSPHPEEVSPPIWTQLSSEQRHQAVWLMAHLAFKLLVAQPPHPSQEVKDDVTP